MLLEPVLGPPCSGSVGRLPRIALGLALIGALAAGCESTDRTAGGDDAGRGAAAAPELRAGPLAYPPTRRVDHVDVLHGVEVADPYRWLEDLDAPETRAWIAAQNALTESYLARIPERDAIRARLEQLWNHERYGLPVLRGGRVFFTRNDGLLDHAVLYVADGLRSEGRVLLDPNQLSADGTVAMSAWSPSDDGTLLAYGVSDGGSDWRTWRVRDVASGEDLPDVVPWTKFSGASWDARGRGFFYTRYAPPSDDAEGSLLGERSRAPQIRYHALGTDPADDPVVYERPDQPDWLLGGIVSDDGRWLVISIRAGGEHGAMIKLRPLQPQGELLAPGPVLDVVPRLGAQYGYVGDLDGVFYFHTDDGAPNGRLVAFDLRKRPFLEPLPVIAEGEHALRDVSLVGAGDEARFVAVSLADAATRVELYDVHGARPAPRLGEVELPGLGTASGFSRQQDAPVTFYAFQSYTTPPRIERLDVLGGDSTTWRRPEVPFDAGAYVTRRAFCTSRDGTRVPVFVTHRAGLRTDGSHPTLLYGYGGFNSPQVPRFDEKVAVWLEMGGVYAAVCLRGGGEYGEAWHEAGTRLQKQNVFDDCIAAAEWLVEQGYTSPRRLALHGRSNGGLLVGAVTNQRPDLFAAVIPTVGVMDMLRFHRFTIGWAWVRDYGSADDADEFAALAAYSPYHNVRDGVDYPAVLATTGDHDDRVVPAHSYKYIAALQRAHAGDDPVLIRIETRAGHGAGKPTSMQIDEAADMWAFLAHELQLDVGALPPR